MKTIYLHIGLGKTGTSYLQKFCGENHENLLNDDIHYVKSSGGLNGTGHQNFAKSFIENFPSYMQPPINPDQSKVEVMHEIKKSSKPSILLSSENFTMAEPANIKSFFVKYFPDSIIKIILFVRSQDDLAESEYNQIIKVRNEYRDFNEYTKSEFDGDFFSLAEKWSKVFGLQNLICKIYDSHVDIVNMFFLCLKNNIQLNGYKTKFENADNNSLGAVGIYMKKMLNKLNQNKYPTESNLHYEIPNELLNKINETDVPAVFLNAKQALKFRKKYYKSNRKLSLKYLNLQLNNLGGEKYTDHRRNEIFSKNKMLVKAIK